MLLQFLISLWKWGEKYAKLFGKKSLLASQCILVKRDQKVDISRIHQYLALSGVKNRKINKMNVCWKIGFYIFWESWKILFS